MKIDRLATAIVTSFVAVFGGLGAYAHFENKKWDAYHSSVLRMAEDGQICPMTALSRDGTRFRACDVFLVEDTGKGYVWYELRSITPQGVPSYFKYDVSTGTVRNSYDGGRISNRCLIGHCRIIREDEPQWGIMRKVIATNYEREQL